MTWVKVDDGFPDHPKALELSLAAMGLWLAGLCYANRQLTDGMLPRAWLRRVADDHAEAAAAELVGAGLWNVTETGWTIHDYAEHQRTREQIKATSEVRAEAGRRGGKQTASKTEANVKQTASKSQAKVQQTKTVCLDSVEANLKQNKNKNKNENPERERETTADAGASAPPNQPYAIFQALCDETGASEDEASRSFKSQQLGIAKKLLDDGFSEADVRECVRYLKSQTWRTGIIDLRTVQAEIGRWAIAGRPAAEPIPIRPGISTRTREQEARDTIDQLLAIANGGPA